MPTPGGPCTASTSGFEGGGFSRWSPSRPPANRSRRSARGGGRADAREGERTPRPRARRRTCRPRRKARASARAARKTPRWPPRPPHRERPYPARRVAVDGVRCGWQPRSLSTFGRDLTKTAARRAPPPLFAAAAFGARRVRARHSPPREDARHAADRVGSQRALRGRRRTRWRPRRSEPRRANRRACHEKRRSCGRDEAGCGGARARGGARDATGGDRDGTATPSARERDALFCSFRALGYVTERAPFAVNRRGTETFVTVSRGAGVPDLRHCEKMRTETGGAAAWRRGRPGHLRAGVPRRPHVRRDRARRSSSAGARTGCARSERRDRRRRRRRHRVAVRLRVGSDIARRERPRSGLGHLEGQARGAGRQDTQDTR